MSVCDVSGGIASLGVNMFAKQHGLAQLPAGIGKAVELNPGILVKREILDLCDPNDDEKIYSLKLSELSSLSKDYLVDRMKGISDQNIYGTKAEPVELDFPQVALTYIGLPGKMSALVWVDMAQKNWADKLQGVVLKWSVPLTQ